MNALTSVRTRFSSWGTIALAGAPAVIQVDTINLLHERVLIDVWGEAAGRRASIEAGSDSARAMLDALFEGSSVERTRRLALARMVFTACGEGRFGIDTDGNRRFAWATSLINSTAIRHESPGADVDGDGFATGFIGASVEAGLDRPPGSIVAREFRCQCRGDSRCELEFVVRDGRPYVCPPSHADAVDGLDPDVVGEDEAKVVELAGQLASYLDAQPVDADGCVTVFGARVSLRPAAWYGQIHALAFEALAAEAGLAVERLHDVERMLARRWVEDLLLPALGSDEFELFAGGLPSTGREVVAHACALARACGLGRWAIGSWESGGSISLRTPWTPESGWLRSYPQRSASGTAGLEGAASALLALGSAVDDGLDPLNVDGARAAIRAGQRRAQHATRASIASGGTSCEVSASLR